MSVHHRTIVQVRDTWSSWRVAEVPIDDLEDVHWRQPLGAPRPILHAYVQCTKLKGEIRPGCTGNGRRLVCVLRRAVTASIHAALARQADNGHHDQQLVSAESANREGVNRTLIWCGLAAGAGLLVATVILSGRSRQAAAGKCGPASTRECGACAA